MNKKKQKMNKKLILIILIGSFLCGTLWFYFNSQETVIDQIISDPLILTYDQIWELIENSEDIEHIKIDEDIYYKNEALFNQVVDDFNAYLEQEEIKFKNKEVIKKK